MNSKKNARVLFVSIMLGVGSLIGVAHATSISGKFTLVQDKGVNPSHNILEGDLVAGVEFDAVDTGTAMGTNNIFNVTKLDFSDLTALLDNNGNGIFGDDLSLIGDFLYEPAGTPVGASTSPGGVSALFDTASGLFVGLSGMIMDTSPFRIVSFEAAGVSLTGASAAVIGGSGYGDSFALVPEPGILMLFGAGLIAVGFGRRRFKAD